MLSLSHSLPKAAAQFLDEKGNYKKKLAFEYI
jgi:hypothetical protein